MNRTKFSENNITEARKTINSLSADLEYMHENIRNTASLFKAMHYGIAEGAVSMEEADDCMTAFQNLLDSVLLDAESTYGMSEDFLEEVM